MAAGSSARVLPAAGRRIRPTIWMYRVRERVGRARIITSAAGQSQPSARMPTFEMTVVSPRAKRPRIGLLAAERHLAVAEALGTELRRPDGLAGAVGVGGAPVDGEGRIRQHPVETHQLFAMKPSACSSNSASARVSLLSFPHPSRTGQAVRGPHWVGRRPSWVTKAAIYQRQRLIRR